MKILSVECSASPVSCAIVNDGRVVGQYYLNTNMTHSQTLMPMVDSLLKCASAEIGDIDLFAVSAGPGSFTGVRIGISAVKGLAFSGNKPCAAVSPLEAMAYNHIDNDAIICSCMDARCNQVYNAVFRVENKTVTRLVEDRALSIAELLEEIKSGKYNGRIILVGDGAEIVYNKAVENSVENIELSSENLRFQSAVGVAFVGEMMYNKGNVVSADCLLPVYLRLPQAERELKAKKEMEKTK